MLKITILLSALALLAFYIHKSYTRIGIIETFSTPEEQSKVIGGERGVQTQFPYIVKFLNLSKEHCGGSIISPDWIVTAAHCVYKYPRPNRYTVIANNEKYSVTKIIMHPGYKPFLHDIALLKINGPITFYEMVQPIELPPAYHKIPVGEYVTVVGWGTTKENGSASPDLRWVDIPTVSDEECQKLYGFKTSIIPSMLCAGFYKGGHDSCQGDSGGPLVGWDEGYPYLAGIISFGRGCGRPKLPGINTEVSHYVDWIKKTIKQY